jgi:hypothetical protein
MNRHPLWIDLDNTPHVPFFEPIIKEMQRRHHAVIVTARDAFQVCELAARKGIPCIKVGRHHGKNRLRKLAGLVGRALQLVPIARREKPALAVSHGSRSQLMVCNWLRIPSVLLDDYEHSRYLPMMRPSWAMLPEVIPADGFCCPPERVRKYPGIKEDVYASRLRPDGAVRTELGLGPEEIVATARPPADEAHYHDSKSDTLFHSFMDRAIATDNVRVVLLPRNARQEAALRGTHPAWFANGRTVVPRAAVDGLNLLWHSDLVVSGGGTMNREAAVLGVPVYSVFRGPMGAVDRWLQQQGRLTLLENVDDVHRRIRFEHRVRNAGAACQSSAALLSIADQLEEILRIDLHLTE